MVGLYCCSGLDRYPGYHIIYNDIISFPGIDLLCDCSLIDFNKYDFILCSPPCNFYSRANYRRYTSRYAVLTKYLLPCCISKCISSGKPFIVENVMNKNLLPKEFDNFCYCFTFNRHTYYTNIILDLSSLTNVKSSNIQNLCRSKRQGLGVHEVFDLFLKSIYF